METNAKHLKSHAKNAVKANNMTQEKTRNNSSASKSTSNANTFIITQAHIHNCAQEPIQFSQRIQRQGVLIGFDLNSGRITSCSENCAQFINESPPDLFKKTVNELPNAGVFANELRKKLQKTPSGAAISIESDDQSPTTKLDLVAHHHNGTGFIEYIPTHALSYAQYRLKVRETQLAIATLLSAENFEAACQIALESIATLTGYDRVQLYKFQPDYSGQVTHEVRANHMPSFKGLFFPASDIPQQARELYRLNPARAIFDAYDTGVAVLNACAMQSNIDLSHAHLRSVSPVHLQYLQNMGVKASMSISLLVDHQLWGLICGHHAQPKIYSLDDRQICKSIADALMLKRANSLQGKYASALQQVRQIENNFAQQLQEKNDISAALAQCQADLLGLHQAQGIAFSYEDQIHQHGNTPPMGFLRGLFEWLQTEAHDNYATDRLWADYPDARDYLDTACGILTQSIDRDANCRIIWFRANAPTAIRWAGNPHEKKIQKTQDTGYPILSPRHSFQQWCDENEQAALAWSENWPSISKEIFRALFTIIEARAKTLAKLNRDLMRANTDLAQYAYAASHDLKAPLRAIDNLTNWLSEDLAGKLTPTDKQNLNEIRKRIDRMENLLDDFLDYATVTPTTDADKKERICSGTALIEDIALLTGYEAPHTIELDEALKTVQLPRHPLQRVLLNLIANALKHNDKEHPSVKLGFYSKDNFWHFTISDNGPGIASCYHEKIFEPYEKLESRDKVEGSGLGLAIVRKITDAEGGSIKITKSSPETGTCFELTWPKQKY